MDTDKLSNKIEHALRSERTAEIDRVMFRECQSDEYEGVDVTITGQTISLDPLFDVIEDMEDWRLKNMGVYSDIKKENFEDLDENDNKYEKGVVVFVVYVGDIIDSEIFL